MVMMEQNVVGATPLGSKSILPPRPAHKHFDTRISSLRFVFKFLPVSKRNKQSEEICASARGDQSSRCILIGGLSPSGTLPMLWVGGDHFTIGTNEGTGFLKEPTSLKFKSSVYFET
jgi:hypothetical protein